MKIDLAKVGIVSVGRKSKIIVVCIIGIVILALLLVWDFYNYRDVAIMRCVIYGTDLILIARIFWCGLIAGLVIPIIFSIRTRGVSEDIPEKIRKRRNAIAIVYGIVMLTLILAFIWVYTTNREERRLKTVSEEEYVDWKTKTGMLDLSDFEKYSADGTIQRLFDSDQVKVKKDYYAPLYIEYGEEGIYVDENGQEIFVYVDITYYEAKDEVIAKKLVRQMAPMLDKYYSNVYRAPEKELYDIELAVDYREFFYRGSGTVLAMQDGNRVATVTFIADLWDEVSKEETPIIPTEEWAKLAEEHFLGKEE